MSERPEWNADGPIEALRRELVQRIVHIEHAIVEAKTEVLTLASIHTTAHKQEHLLQLESTKSHVDGVSREVELRFMSIDRSVETAKSEVLNLAKVHTLAHSHEHTLQTEATKQQIEAGQHAADKAEEAQKLRNEQQNNWRQTMQDANAQFARKTEMDATLTALAASKVTEHNAIDSNIDSLTIKVAEMVLRSQSNSEKIADLNATVTWVSRLVVGLVIVALVALVVGRTSLGVGP